MTRLRMAVIGVGHLGKEHARVLSGLNDVELVGVADVNVEQARAVAERVGAAAFADYRPLLDQVDAACIVVPTTYHLNVASAFLERGIPVLVEKPLALNLQQANALVELSEKHSALLQVGHIERFNPAFEELERRPLQPKLIRCERLGPFSGRSSDIGVVLDLMIHDLDLLLALVRSPVRSVEALGMSVFGGHEDVAHARLVFVNGCQAEISASRAHPTPSRQMHVWAPEGFAHLDFAQRRLSLIQPSDQLRRHGLDPARLEPAMRTRLKDELFGRHLEVLTLDGQRHDQLTAELRDFVHCVQTGDRPRVSGVQARDAITLGERIVRALQIHRWDSAADSPIGPHHLPAPLGPLFAPPAQNEAA